MGKNDHTSRPFRSTRQDAHRNLPRRPGLDFFRVLEGFGLQLLMLDTKAKLLDNPRSPAGLKIVIWECSPKTSVCCVGCIYVSWRSAHCGPDKDIALLMMGTLQKRDWGQRGSVGEGPRSLPCDFKTWRTNDDVMCGITSDRSPVVCDIVVQSLKLIIRHDGVRRSRS